MLHSSRLLRLALVAIPLAAMTADPANAFQVQGLFQFGPKHIGLTYTDSVNAAQAVDLAHYTITPQGAPAITVQSAVLQENHRTVILITAGKLPSSRTYSITVSGVTSRDGDPLTAGGPTTLSTVVETVMGIDEVHANINTLAGQTITVIGQVFLTASSGGSTGSAYIQDGTGRGLNLFGNPVQPVTDALGSVVLATGTAALFFSTVEITPFTASALASGQPPLAPKVLTVADASSPQWEGTYIQTTATLTAAGVASGSNNYNYSASGGGMPFIYRVRNATGLNPAPVTTGDMVTGAGAGAVFQSTYQVLVGNAADFYKGAPTLDTTPPTLVSASGDGGASTITVTFSEPVATGAAVAANYTVHPTGTPGSPIAVTSAAAGGAVATLTLAAPLAAGTAYTVIVSNVADAAGNVILPSSTAGFTATGSASFAVVAAFPFGATYVGVAFSDRVNAAQAVQIANYSFTPPLALAGATVQDNGQTVILHTVSPLPASTSYQLTVSGVTSAAGDPLASGGPFSFQTVSGNVVDIADIHAHLDTWTGQNVTIIGQVFIPVGSRGGTPSGYIQDGSGRGVNMFGGSLQQAVNAPGNVVRVSGLVEQYFTTVEITGYTATAIATDIPHLGPRILTVAQANSSQWEGTYIQTAATLTAITASGASNYNYDASDAGANITFRVGNGLGIQPSSFAVGDRVTGRGAGGAFQSTFQINIGNAVDFFKAGGPDTEPPLLGAASGVSGSSLVTLTFSEPVDASDATTAANYQVYPVSSPSSPIAITGVTQASGGSSVTLSLAVTLAASTSYAIRVANIHDLAGNVIIAGSTVTFVSSAAPPTRASISVPPVTLVRGLAGQGELFPITISAVLDTKVSCRIFDVQGRLVKVLFDGRLSGNATRTLTWDGRDETFEFVPAGLYVCLVESTDNAGNSTRDRVPIVVAVRLQ